MGRIITWYYLSNSGGQEAAGQACANKQSGKSGACEHQPQISQSGATAAESAQSQGSAEKTAVAGATTEGSSGGDTAAWRAFRLLNRPTRLLAVERLSMEERAAVRAAGTPEEAM